MSNQEIADKAARLSNVTPESEARTIAWQKEKEESRRLEVQRELKQGWNVPLRQYQTKPSFAGPWGDTFAKLKSRLGEGFMVALYGANGNGKTQLGMELMRSQVHDRQCSALFTTAMQFFMEIKATYKKDCAENEQAVLRKFSEPKLLVVDEVEKRGESAWENNLLFDLFNRRYNSVSDTLLISNLNQSDLDQHLGRSLVSRLNETGGMVHCTWPSRR